MHKNEYILGIHNGRGNLQWTCARTMLDMVTNEVYRKEIGTAPNLDEVRDERLRWFDHDHRRRLLAPIRRVDSNSVEGVRRRV